MLIFICTFSIVARFNYYRATWRWAYPSWGWKPKSFVIFDSNFINAFLILYFVNFHDYLIILRAFAKLNIWTGKHPRSLSWRIHLVEILGRMIMSTK